MKQKKSPTREQKKLLAEWKLNPSDWFIVKNTSTELVIVNRYSDQTIKTIPKV